MGEQTGVNSRYVAAEKATPRPLRLGIDVPMLLAVAFLLGFGLLMVYSASWQQSIKFDKPIGYYFLNQVRWLVLSLPVAAFFMYFDYRRWKKLVVVMMAVTLILLVVVLFVGVDLYNARRTLFNGSITPSEVAKMAIVIYMSFWLSSKRAVINSLSLGIVPMVTILGVTAGLIMLQPDLSATLTILILGGLLFFMAGADFRQIVTILLAVGILGGIMVALSTTGQVRIHQYLAGLQDPSTSSDQIQRSVEAIVRGGIFGVGIGQGTVKFVLPVSHADTIFGVVIEETGLVGAVAVILAYLVIMWRGLRIAAHASDMTGRLLAAGLTLWITFEAFLNMGTVVTIIPVSGNSLPLMSAGGTSLIMTLVAIGLIFSVSRVSNRETAQQEGRSFGAVVNLRRGDGGRRVSRAHRSSGIRS
ncbi:MAG TPA: FtsW/RodA/SpoVE family cell cycle protein [Bellilinea sp.]|nr:FtsW/RodA/SpoVE family cell cycle protein [Bellilinea sp.]